jgi:predicted PurR-regulated permease PerM
MASPALEEFKSLTKITDAEITQKLISFGQTLLGVLTDSLKGFFQSVPFVALEALVVLATLLVMLIKTGTLREVVLRIFAHNSLQLVRVMKRGEALAHSILTAAVMTAVIQASLIGIAASICGNSHVLGILLLSFLMAFIPVIGTVPISIFLIIQSGVDGNQFAAIVYGVNLLLVGSIDNFIRPLLMSGKNGLHPLLAFVAAIGGVSAFGFYGLFLGPVTIGLTIILIDEMIS